ncbi:MAG: hypothetical protein GY856_14490 [bacterium]|nr:hypothetical protein [bacterium]
MNESYKRYADRLAEAIELVLSEIERKRPDAFVYRGVNLKNAAERYLYIRYLSDERLSSLFLQSEKSSRGGTVHLRRGIEHALASALIRGRSDSGSIRVEPRRLSILKMMAKLRPYHLKRLLRITFQYLGRHFKYRALNLARTEERHPVFFFIVNIRFATYLGPIRERLGFRALFYLGFDHKMIPHAARRGLPFACSRRPFRSLSLSTKKRCLNSFGNIAYWYDAYHGALKTLKPACILLAEGTHLEAELVSRAGEALGIPVLCIQHGTHVDGPLMKMNFEKMMTWGHGFQEMYGRYSPHQDFIITGNHIIGTEARGPRGDLTGKAISFFLQYPHPFLEEGADESFYRLILDVADSFLRERVVVREHPTHGIDPRRADALGSRANIRLMPPHTHSLGEVLAESKLSVSISSTVIIESVAAGVLPMEVNLTGYPNIEPDVEREGAGIAVGNTRDAFDVIARVVAEPECLRGFDASMQAFQKKYFNIPDPVGPLKKITDLVEQYAPSESFTGDPPKAAQYRESGPARLPEGHASWRT